MIRGQTGDKRADVLYPKPRLERTGDATPRSWRYGIELDQLDGKAITDKFDDSETGELADLASPPETERLLVPRAGLLGMLRYDRETGADCRV